EAVYAIAADEVQVTRMDDEGRAVADEVDEARPDGPGSAGRPVADPPARAEAVSRREHQAVADDEQRRVLEQAVTSSGRQVETEGRPLGGAVGAPHFAAVGVLRREAAGPREFDEPARLRRRARVEGPAREVGEQRLSRRRSNEQAGEEGET